MIVTVPPEPLALIVPEFSMVKAAPDWPFMVIDDPCSVDPAVTFKVEALTVIKPLEKPIVPLLVKVFTVMIAVLPDPAELANVRVPFTVAVPLEGASAVEMAVYVSVTPEGRLNEVNVLPAGRLTGAVVNEPPDAVPLELRVSVCPLVDACIRAIISAAVAEVEPENEPLIPVNVMEPLADPNVVELVIVFDPVAVPLVVMVIGLLLPVASMLP